VVLPHHPHYRPSSDNGDMRDGMQGAPKVCLIHCRATTEQGHAESTEDIRSTDCLSLAILIGWHRNASAILLIPNNNLLTPMLLRFMCLPPAATLLV
jgi:hypothetical protein